MVSSDWQVMTAWARAGSDRSVAMVVFALLAAASLLPVLLTPIPAMVDYPNHLARMYLLSQNGTPDANPYYEVAWALYPNLAMDLLVPQMARLISVENATRLFLLLSQLLIVGGALGLERVVKGRVHLAGFAALMFLYCLPFSWGFVNFEFGLGLTLWGIAAYLMVAERAWPLRFAVNAVFVAALFAAHFFSLGVYGATLGVYELWRAHDRKAPYRDAALRLVVLAVPALVLFWVMRWTAGSIGSEGTTWLFEFKPLWLFRIMNGYNLTVSAATALALVALLYLAARRGVLKLEPAGIWLAIGFALLYLAIPSKLFGTSFVDLRVIPAAALIIPAFCSLSLPSRRWTMAALAAVSAITLANLTVVYAVWLPYRADYASIIASFRQDRPRFKGACRRQRRGRGPAIQRPHAISDVLCSDAGGALRQRLCAERVHRGGQAAGAAARRRPRSRHPLWRAGADPRACRDRGRPNALRHSAFHPRLAA